MSFWKVCPHVSLKKNDPPTHTHTAYICTFHCLTPLKNWLFLPWYFGFLFSIPKRSKFLKKIKVGFFVRLPSIFYKMTYGAALPRVFSILSVDLLLVGLLVPFIPRPSCRPLYKTTVQVPPQHLLKLIKRTS